MLFLKKKKNVLVIGSKGQLGSYLLEFLSEKSLQNASGIGTVYGISDLDISDKEAVSAFFYNHPKIHYVINCAAYTDTAKAENDGYNDCYKANVLGPKNLAFICDWYGIKLVHISTDYVFSENSANGRTLPTMFLEEFPVNVYGLHKLLGEKEIQLKMKTGSYAILRTSWLYGNSKNTFIYKFLKNCAAKARDAKCNADIIVDVVDDAFGKPTHVKFLSEVILDVVQNDISGIFDAQQNAKMISRADYAKVILDVASSFSEISWINRIKINSVKSSSFKTAVRHPLFSNSMPIGNFMTHCSQDSFDSLPKLVIGPSTMLNDIKDYIVSSQKQIVEAIN